MMFSGNGYTQKPLSWEKRKVWGNKKKKEKVAPQRDFGGSEGHKSTDKAHFDKRQDMWIFGRRFSPQEDNGSRKENKLQLQENLIKSQRNTNK